MSFALTHFRDFDYHVFYPPTFLEVLTIMSFILLHLYEVLSAWPFILEVLTHWSFPSFLIVSVLTRNMRGFCYFPTSLIFVFSAWAIFWPGVDEIQGTFYLTKNSL
ncbi:MAG: hypothetical protein JOS17DRAFT_738128 [Linnemannia elongata]|nr:MAG: hypothetical protein JOS17DRAFT_738128 [Linnemannia elongata]